MTTPSLSPTSTPALARAFLALAACAPLASPQSTAPARTTLAQEAPGALGTPAQGSKKTYLPTPCVFQPEDAAQALRPDPRRVRDRAVAAVRRKTQLDLSPTLEREPRRTPASIATTGNAKNLVICLLFAEHGPLGQNRILPTQADLDTIWNAPGGDPVLAPTGSVRDAWLENSYGVFTFDSTVVAWFDVPGTENHYADGSSGLSIMIWDLIRDGLDAVDPVVDFTQFDDNGDGRIDVLTVLHSGYGAEFGGVDQYGTPQSDRIWSHRWALDVPWVSAEGIDVSDYSISPAFWDTTGFDPVRIGVLAHELGHILGLPDLYDTDGTSIGSGYWDLMASGAWGFDGSQRYPSHLSAWCKWKLGWVDPIQVAPGSTIEIGSVEEQPDVGLIDCGYGVGEYLLIEHRDQIGLDALLPGPGMALWHIDERKGSLVFNNPNADEGYPGMPGTPIWPTNDSHYRVALVQPDGFFDLERSNSAADAGDLFPFAGISSVDGSQTPGIDRYQSGVSINTGNLIQGISNAPGILKFQYQNNMRPLITPTPVPPATQWVPYTHTLTGTGGVGPYVWSEWVESPSYVHEVLPTSSFAATGVAQGWNADDDGWRLSLPFAFPFWETAYDTVLVSSNGYLDFVPGEESDFIGSANLLPMTMRIAPLWGDLTTQNAAQDIYVDTATAGQITIRWDALTLGTSAPCNFAVTLFRNGDIRFDYGPGNALDFETPVGIGRGHSGDCAIVPGYSGSSTLTNLPSVLFRRLGSKLPRGLWIDRDGTIQGTPEQSGTFQPVFQYADEVRNCDRRVLSIDVQASTIRRGAPGPMKRP